MPTVIHLTAAQASAVAGVSSVDPHAALVPVAMTDGTFILGAQVLTDPLYADRLPVLQLAPVVDIATLAAIMPVSAEI